MHQNIHFIPEISQLQIIHFSYHSSYCVLCLVKIFKGFIQQPDDGPDRD